MSTYSLQFRISFPSQILKVMASGAETAYSEDFRQTIAATFGGSVVVKNFSMSRSHDGVWDTSIWVTTVSEEQHFQSVIMLMNKIDSDVSDSLHLVGTTKSATHIVLMSMRLLSFFKNPILM